MEKRQAYLSIVDLNVAVVEIEQVLFGEDRVAAAATAVHQHVGPSYAAVHVHAGATTAIAAHVQTAQAVAVAVVEAAAAAVASAPSSAPAVHGIRVEAVQRVRLLPVPLTGRRLLQHVGVPGRLRGGVGVNLVGVVGVLLLAGEAVQVGGVGVGGGHCRRRVGVVKVELLLLEVVRRRKVGRLKVGRRRRVGEASGGGAEGAGAPGAAAKAGDRPEAAPVAGDEVTSVLEKGKKQKLVIRFFKTNTGCSRKLLNFK